jgi:hypothetical protein
MDLDRIAHYDDPRGSGRDVRIADVRASDADRAVTAELLQRHYAAGRLEAKEFEERVGRCFAARTMSELHGLVVDLPRSPAPALEPHRGRDERHQVRRLALVAPLVLALVVVFGLTGAHVVWLAWPLAFFALRAGMWQGRRRWNW